MLSEKFLTVEDVAEILNVSVQTAYRVIHQLNDELKEKACVVVSGRVSQKYFRERLYC